MKALEQVPQFAHTLSGKSGRGPGEVYVGPVGLWKEFVW